MNNIEIRDLSKEQLLALKEQIDSKLQEPEYPLCFRNRNIGSIWLFENPTKAKLLKANKVELIVEEGEYFDFSMRNHTDTEYWEPYPYDKERDLYHGQMVYCWDDGWNYVIHIGFYDAINNYVFYAGNGDLDGVYYDNYSATVPEFMLNAYDSLEGINNEI